MAGNQDQNNLCAGDYDVTVEDSHSCQVLSTYSVSQPPPINVTQDALDDVTCNSGNDGSISISVSGGTAPYSYNWATVGGCGVTAGDQDQTNLCAGDYFVTVTDNSVAGCTTTQSYTVSEPNAITINDVVTDISCYGLNDGEIDITAGGGTPGYTYNWSSSTTCSAVAAQEDQAGLCAGDYDVTVSDTHGCTSSKTINVTQPTEIVITNDLLQDVSCNAGSDGVLNISVSGGTGPYVYNWTTVGGCGVVALNEDQSNLCAGDYDVTVTDNSGNACTSTATYTITEPTVLTLTNLSSNISCEGLNDGEIDITAGGGTPGYTYNWSSSTTCSVVAAQEDQTGLCAGDYDVTVSDNKGCTITDTYTLTEPTALT
ncbi:MAG: hypothetical protein C0594_13685, partial [Marinilabiliales bacterium]